MDDLTNRAVKRVLVMCDYGDGRDDVFDITALVGELAAKTEHRTATVTLTVRAHSNYAQPLDKETGNWPLSTEASWRVSANFHVSGEAAYLDDAVNSAMPDSFTTENLRKKLERLDKKRREVAEDIQVQRLRDASLIRAQHPIARVQIEAKQLPQPELNKS